MNLCIIITLLVCAAYPSAMSRTLHFESSIDEIHHQWMIKYGRTYANTSEMEKRRTIFKENLEFYEKTNKINKAAGKNYTLGLNYYSDFTFDEMTSSCVEDVDVPHELISSKTVLFNMSLDEIPESVDWRERGAVTYVKQQGTCGACWAFATMAALEGFWQIKTGNLVSLAPQHLIDCDRDSHGCQGGFYTSAFKFETITHSGGVPSEPDYPYQESRQNCRNDFTISAGFRGFGIVLRGDEEQLLQAVAHQPIAAQIASSPEMRAFHGSDIYSGSCGAHLNHAVAIVGYGVLADGRKYWIIKGSWGEEWGESGYMKLIRGTGTPGGYCGIHAGLSFFPALIS